MYMTFLRRNNAFTLLEIVIVLGIIGVLATVGAASFRSTIDDTRISRAETDLEDLKKSVESSRVKSGQLFGQITGNYCSFCNACTGDLRNVPDSHTCMVRWMNIVNRVSAAGYGDITDYVRDPWGSPYVVDENDGEYVSNPCRQDWIRSVGPDGIFLTGDDIIIYLATYHPSCS